MPRPACSPPSSVALKDEVYVRTDKAIIEPGYLYYLYYRKWFPRGGLKTTNAPYTPVGSNWQNSIHSGVAAGGYLKKQVYDSLVVRRLSKTVQTTSSGYWAWTGYDLKPTSVYISGVGPKYDYPGNGSSVRACVSFTLADSDVGLPPHDPVTSGGSAGPTGVVLYGIEVDQAATVAFGANTGRNQVITAAQDKRALRDFSARRIGGTTEALRRRLVAARRAPRAAHPPAGRTP